MDSVARAAAVYFFLVLVLRLAGKRTLQEVTVFDAVLLLIISEATQQALLGQDFSLTAAFLVVSTLIILEITFSLIGDRFRLIDHVLDSRPEVVFQDGKPIDKRMKKHRLSEEDIIEAARELQGLERLEQVKYAVLERGGKVTIVPVEGAGG